MSTFLLILALTLNAAANVLLKIGAKAGTVPAGSLAEKALQFFNGVTVINRSRRDPISAGCATGATGWRSNSQTIPGPSYLWA